MLFRSVSAATPEVTFRELNAALKLSLWQDANLWDDKADAVADRLDWPVESKTDTETSYRRYAPDGTKVLGSQVYSEALYAEAGKVTQVSLVFINKGDYANLFLRSGMDADAFREFQQERRKRLRGFAGAFRQERDAIEAALRQVLGEPRRDRFGQSTQTTENVKRWDWEGHSILLAAPNNEYIALRIVPTSLADANGKAARITDSKLRELLAKRVQKRPNGDVVVTQIPMVDQGPKGFCVPATWERYLRYVGIPADMYLLSMAAETEFGGGTYITEMAKSVAGLVRQSGRRIEKISRNLSIAAVANYVDRGQPLMWGMYQQGELDYRITNRTNDRKSVKDWDKWLETIKPDRRDARRYRYDKRTTGHMCLIIGYNKTTDEIAISDSWGPDFAERWITLEEAQHLDQGELYVIAW